jgi:hypothetical protein
MTLPTQTATLGQVFTRYAYNKIGGREYKDNKYKTKPLLKLLTERQLSGDGGESIVHPVNLGTSAQGGSLSRNQEFSITGDSNETWARYTWKTIYEPCFVSWWDIREARNSGRGMTKMLGILDSRLNETRENMEDNIATMLAQSTAADSDDIQPILVVVKTTGALGGLNPSTAGQTTWAATNEATINWSVEGVARVREGVTTISDNKGTLDVILLPDQFWQETCEIGDSALVINQDAATRGGTKYADLGMQVPFILGIPVIHDQAWNTDQTATGVGLDLDGIHMVVDPQWDMYTYPFEDMVYFGRLGQATVQIKVCELTCSSRRTQLLLSTIS